MNMIQQKNQIIIIVVCFSLFILIGLLITFFGDMIININKPEFIKKIPKLLFSKWIFVGFIFNILIMIGYFLIYLQIYKSEEGEQGIIGDTGIKGDNGIDSKKCC